MDQAGIPNNIQSSAAVTQTVQPPVDQPSTAPVQPIQSSVPPTTQAESEQKENVLQNDIDVPANAVSGPGREFAPTASVIEAAPIQEVVQPSDTLPELPKEVKDAGVEVSPPTQPVLSADVQQATGIRPAKDAVPIPVTPSPAVQIPNLPMDEVKAEQMEKIHPVVDSVRWLGKLTVFVIEHAKKAHEQLTGK